MMAIFEGFSASFKCDDCGSPYASRGFDTTEFSTAEEMLIAVLSETEWNFTVKDGDLVVLCSTCNMKRQAKAREGRDDV